ncbi:MAG: ribosome recycling factor [Acidobacteria bacterium 13_1_20CM_2_55_15]|nr:MAG: ribosome recycling factor [Acidobacteria bacterium 13_1_40CM_3_56_11]OLD68041.1 MAG: ribosome recycling factor [Acidobacteria bacterium 13_1_40CM_2_56_11]OLE86170.1 MAG: ribosome recycling factor [Acidobacteria bacterium 13_1_20CM_2_55_15]PYR66425.1 MAG: ribosome recycling factor [Acidobacteriota bacterium]PYS12192.1 MAG: ribosome recycling factor [Acidobacteriota bacterium]
MAIKDEVAQIRKRMEKAIDDIRKELASIRTGRASISILDNIQVDYYGTPTPINQAAQLGTPDPTLVTVQPYDVSLVGPIEKAIRASDLGLNPSNDGRLIRIPIPPLTEERRKQLAKHVHRVLEEHRTAVRNIRRDGNEHLKKMLKDKLISEDDEKHAIAEIQKLTDDHIRKLEEVAKKKEQEILTV